MNFKELKEEILKRAKAIPACADEYEKAYKAETAAELMEVVKDNFFWVCNEKVLDGDLIDKYAEIFNENEIYHNVNISKGFAIASDSATVRASDSATVEAWGSAYINCHSTIECKISEKSIICRWNTNTIQYCSDDLKFEKVEKSE